jgi:hypothetical protein
MKKTALSIFLACLIFLSLFLFDDDLVTSAETLPISTTTGALVTISADIGSPVLKLWGYGSPNSRIEVSGDKVSDFTYSASDGYFEFQKVYLPSPDNAFYPELCLIGIDVDGRSTPPTCIPPLPANGFSYDIGPVILPPTLSLEAGTVAPSTQVEASGITIPDSEVKIVMAEDNVLAGSKSGQSLAHFDIVKKAKAYFIPNYTVRSDRQGNFSFNMPSTSITNWRIFAITNYSQGARSPKSNTLIFNVISPGIITMGNIWKFILSLLILPVLIIFEVAVILLIIVAIILNKKGHKTKAYLNVQEPIKEYQEYLKSKHLL